MASSITHHHLVINARSPNAQAPPKGPDYIKMFSPEQVTALAHMFKGVIDTYSDGASGNQQSGASEYLDNDQLYELHVHVAG